MRIALTLVVVCCLAAGLGCQRRKSFGESWYEEKANKADYEGRHEDAQRERENAQKAREDDDKYQGWKKSNRR